MNKFEKIEGYPYAICSNGEVLRIWKGGFKKRKPQIQKDGYLRIGLYKDGKPGKFFMVHRLVADAFVFNPGSKPYVNHKNGIKSDNRADNLEWCTRSENMKHSYKNNLHTMTMGNAKLNEAQVRLIRHLKVIEPKMTLKEVAKIFDVSYATISMIQNGVTWSRA